MVLSLFALAVVCAAPPDVLVVETRRSGVTKKAAHSLTSLVAAQLQKGGVTAEAVLEQSAVCQAKKKCLIDLGKSKKSPVVVSIQAVAVLDDLTIRVEAISVDEDGRELATIEHSGRLTAAGQLANQDAFAPKVLGMIPLMERAVTIRKPPEPAKTVDPIKPPGDAPVATPLVVNSTPAAPPTVETPAVKSSGRTFTWVAAGAAIAAGGVGVTFGILEANARNEIANPSSPDPMKSVAQLEAERARNQTIANVSYATAGVAAAAAIVLFFVEGK